MIESCEGLETNRSYNNCIFCVEMDLAQRNLSTMKTKVCLLGLEINRDEISLPVVE